MARSKSTSTTHVCWMRQTWGTQTDCCPLADCAAHLNCGAHFRAAPLRRGPARPVQKSHLTGISMKQRLTLLTFTLAVAATFATAQMQPGTPTGPGGTMGQPGSSRGQHIPGVGEPGMGGSTGIPGQDQQQQQQQQTSTPTVDDGTLERQLHEEFTRNPEMADVQVQVEKGVVTLQGSVPSKEDKKKAKQIAESVPGVRKVREKLTVKPGGASASTNSDTLGISTGSNTARNAEQENNTSGSIAGNTAAASGTETGTSAMGQAGASTSSAPSTNPGTTPNGEAPSATTPATSSPATSSPNTPPGTSTPGSMTPATPPTASTCPCNSMGAGSLGTSPAAGKTGTAVSGPATATTMTCPCANPGGGAVAQGSTPSRQGSSGNVTTTGGVSGTATGGASVPGSAAGTSGNIGAASGASSGPSGGTATEQSENDFNTVPDSKSLQGQIQTSLKNDPTLANENVTVNVTPERIELSGSVPTGKEKQTARRIAESYAAERKVVDHITVAGRGPSSTPADTKSNSAGTSKGSDITAAPGSTGPGGAGNVGSAGTTAGTTSGSATGTGNSSTGTPIPPQNPPK